MHRVFSHNWVVFFQLHAIGGVFAVLLRDIARSAGQAAILMLGAFEDNLEAVTFRFLCHDMLYLNRLLNGSK